MAEAEAKKKRKHEDSDAEKRERQPAPPAGAPAAAPPPNLWPPTPPVPPAPNPRVQGILLGLMRERGDIYAGFTDVELRGLLQAHAGDVAACHETVLRLQAAGAARGVSSSELFRQTAPPPPPPGTVLRGPYQPGGPAPPPSEPQRPKKKRHRPSRDKARDRVLRRVPLTLQDVDALDWNEACEYAKAMGVSKKSHTTRDAYRDACKTWFVGRETDVFVPAKAPAAPRKHWQRSLPDSAPSTSRGKYKCGRCGQIKVNHICPFAGVQSSSEDDDDEEGALESAVVGGVVARRAEKAEKLRREEAEEAMRVRSRCFP